MTKEYTFYGASDDLFLAALNGRDVEEVYPPSQYALKHGDETMVISAVYGQRVGVWNIGVEPFDEDKPIPSWPVSFKLNERGYSAAMTVKVPDETTLTILPAA